MARMRRKGDLPEKVCAQCGRPFAWRKAWARCWDEVRYCSDRCRGEAKSAAKAARRREDGGAGDGPAGRDQ